MTSFPPWKWDSNDEGYPRERVDLGYICISVKQTQEAQTTWGHECEYMEDKTNLLNLYTADLKPLKLSACFQMLRLITAHTCVNNFIIKIVPELKRADSPAWADDFNISERRAE